MVSNSSSRRNLIQSNSHPKIDPNPVTVSGVSFASTLWLVFNFLVCAGLVITAAFPYWTTSESPPTSLQATHINTGLYYLCYTPGLGQSAAAQQICSLIIYPPFVPSNITNLATIELRDIAFLITSGLTYAVGIGLLMISFIVGVIAYCKPKIKDQSIFLVAFVIQIFACIFLIIGLVLFPLFYHSNFARQFCGINADYYIRGRCAVGWCAQVAMVVVSLSFYLPPLAIFSMNMAEGLKAYKCC
jgi:hypothetical protein